MSESKVNVRVLNGRDMELVKVVACVLIDPVSGLPTAPGGGGGGTTPAIDFELLVIQDANGVEGIRRETNVDGVITVEYVTLGGAPWDPVAPVTLVKPSLADNAATAANQATLNTAFGQQSDAEAGSASGAFSLMALVKRLGSQLTLMSNKLPASLGTKTAATSLSTTPASDANVSRETYGAVTIFSISSPAVGTNWSTFAASVCSSLDIVNNTGVDIEYRRNGAGSSMVIRDGYSRLVQGITNTNNVQVRRVDQSNTVVTLTAEAFTV